VNKDIRDCIFHLKEAGIGNDDAQMLRRIAMTLHRWHELECGNSNNFSSWAIVRGRKDACGAFECEDDGRPYLERHWHKGPPQVRYEPIADRERGAKKRLAKIMAKYPTMGYYIQTDPRGAALYILTAEQLSSGRPIDQI
jgi:hypothetical protein